MDFTATFRQQVKELESRGLIDFIVLDLASVVGHVTVDTLNKKILSTNVNGMFPAGRFLIGDEVEVYSNTNTGTFTISSVDNNYLIVEEEISEVTTPELMYINNYIYNARYVHNVMFYKMEKGLLINDEGTEQEYIRTSALREQIQVGKDNPDGKVEITFSNADRYLETLLLERNRLKGCYMYLITSFIDNCPQATDDYRYIGSYPDYLSVKINPLRVRSTSIADSAVKLTLGPQIQLSSSQLPAGRISSAICEWAKNYGGTECDPEGNIDYVTYPTCDGTKKSCRERGNISRIGLFPGIPKGAIRV